MGKEATTFYKRLADMIAQKRQHPYPMVMGWLRCRLSFASIRSAIMCIRGSRSSLHRQYFTRISGGACSPSECLNSTLVYHLLFNVYIYIYIYTIYFILTLTFFIFIPLSTLLEPCCQVLFLLPPGGDYKKKKIKKK